jgi:hypothetical protein
MKLWLSGLALVLCAQLNGAVFRNLNFEEANTAAVVPTPPKLGGGGTGPTAELLPGWQVFRGGTAVTTVGFNLFTSMFAREGGVSLTGSEFLPAIAGRFSLDLNVPSEFINPNPLSIGQRGDIPSEVRFLTYTYRDQPFIASINGVDLIRDFQNAGLPSTSLIDISKFAGQTVDLFFRPARGTTGNQVGRHTIDSIGFVVPEPSTYALMIVGSVFLGARWFRAQFNRKTAKPRD